ncbi:MAG: transporter ATP-binding protein [Deltaproteobacteria bacterium]|nr:transporter ATP-binding protein [Deltaproteobacteria bacterium]
MKGRRSPRSRPSSDADDEFSSHAPFAMADAVSGPTGGPVVHAEGLGKAFGRAVVLRDLTVSVTAGEVVALFGPNGAGKSTLLRLLATLMTPTAGFLRLFGDAGSSLEVRRRIGLVAHQSFLYPDLTARENLLFYAGMYGLEDAEARTDAWLERVALADARARPVRLFSRGMEQRLALARALLHDPELILLDEPWSGLDAASTDWLDGLLLELRSRRRTVVVATHDFQRGLGVATRALIIHRGRLAWETPIASDALVTVDAMYRQITGAVAA